MTTAPKVQRWSLEFYNDGRRIMQKMKEKDDGYYVEHSDYAALAARCERLEKALGLLVPLAVEALEDRTHEAACPCSQDVVQHDYNCANCDCSLGQLSTVIDWPEVQAALSALAPEPQQDEREG